MIRPARSARRRRDRRIGGLARRSCTGARRSVPSTSTAFVAAFQRPITTGALDVVAPVSIVPEHGSGYPGRPGLLGAGEGGRNWSPRFAPDVAVQ